MYINAFLCTKQALFLCFINNYSFTLMKPYVKHAYSPYKGTTKKEVNSEIYS